MPEQPKSSPSAQPAPAANAPESAGTSTEAQRVPPQGGGVGPKPFVLGAPPRYVKYNVAVKILADPVARTTFSQPYSGQRRIWGS